MPKAVAGPDEHAVVALSSPGTTRLRTSSLSPAVALLANHAVDIVERLGVAVTRAGEVALQAGLSRVHYFLLCDDRYYLPQ